MTAFREFLFTILFCLVIHGLLLVSGSVLGLMGPRNVAKHEHLGEQGFTNTKKHVVWGDQGFPKTYEAS